MWLKSILIDSAKIEKISNSKWKLKLNILPLDENDDLEPNISLKLYINNELVKTLISDENWEIDDSLVVDTKEDNLKIQIKNFPEDINSKIKVLVKNKSEYDKVLVSSDNQYDNSKIKVLVKNKSEYDKVLVSSDNQYDNINIWDLIKKDNMTDKDKENIMFVVDILEKEWLLKYRSIKLLMDNISYGVDYIFVWWIEFFREKHLPNIEFDDMPNWYGVFFAKETWIYKTYHNNKLQYYMIRKKYEKYCEYFWAFPLHLRHIEMIRHRLPKKSWSDFGLNILWYILGLDKSGYIFNNKEWVDNLEKWYLTLWKNQSFVFNEYWGETQTNKAYDSIKEMAFPFLFIKNSLY